MGSVVSPGLDDAWLDAEARRDPLRHAFAVWDRLRFPDRVSFLTLREDGRPTAYLLLWRGAPPHTYVHWVGDAPNPLPLLALLPRRPLTVVAPLELADAIARRIGGTSAVVRLLAFDPDRPAPPPLEGRARALGAVDTELLHAFGRASPEPLVAAYRTVDPARDRVFGAFHDGRLAAVARAQVALPKVWLIGGVYTDPEHRNLGLGADLMRLIVRTALSEGARPALYVLEANAAARRLYERLGFDLVERRARVEAT